MNDSTRLTAGARSIELYPDGAPSAAAPVVFLLAGEESGGAVRKAVRALTDAPFSLAAIPVGDWENELSPWAAEKVFRGGRDFGGGADDTIRLLEREIVPAVLAALECPGAPCCIAGYSLSGLCALYAPYRTAAFGAVVSASGSLWFPGFSEFAASHAFARRPERVYCSLGDRESRTKNPAMSCVEDNTRRLCGDYRARGIDCAFELNPGNHFQDAELRLARGIAWIIR